MNNQPLCNQIMYIFLISGFYSKDLNKDHLGISLVKTVFSSQFFILGCQFKYLLEVAIDHKDESPFITCMIQLFIEQVLNSEKEISDSSKIILCYIAQLSGNKSRDVHDLITSYVLESKPENLPRLFFCLMILNENKCEMSD